MDRKKLINCIGQNEYEECVKCKLAGVCVSIQCSFFPVDFDYFQSIEYFSMYFIQLDWIEITHKSILFHTFPNHPLSFRITDSIGSFYHIYRFIDLQSSNRITQNLSLTHIKGNEWMHYLWTVYFELCWMYCASPSASIQSEYRNRGYYL